MVLPGPLIWKITRDDRLVVEIVRDGVGAGVGERGRAEVVAPVRGDRRQDPVRVIGRIPLVARRDDVDGRPRDVDVARGRIDRRRDARRQGRLVVVHRHRGIDRLVIVGRGVPLVDDLQVVRCAGIGARVLLVVGEVDNCRRGRREVELLQHHRAAGRTGGRGGVLVLVQDVETVVVVEPQGRSRHVGVGRAHGRRRVDERRIDAARDQIGRWGLGSERSAEQRQPGHAAVERIGPLQDAEVFVDRRRGHHRIVVHPDRHDLRRILRVDGHLHAVHAGAGAADVVHHRRQVLQVARGRGRRDRGHQGPRLQPLQVDPAHRRLPGPTEPRPGTNPIAMPTTRVVRRSRTHDHASHSPWSPLYAPQITCGGDSVCAACVGRRSQVRFKESRKHAGSTRRCQIFLIRLETASPIPKSRHRPLRSPVLRDR